VTVSIVAAKWSILCKFCKNLVLTIQTVISSKGKNRAIIFYDGDSGGASSRLRMQTDSKERRRQTMTQMQDLERILDTSANRNGGASSSDGDDGRSEIAAITSRRSTPVVPQQQIRIESQDSKYSVFSCVIKKTRSPLRPAFK
jgi:hypothetical protein